MKCSSWWRSKNPKTAWSKNSVARGVFLAYPHDGSHWRRSLDNKSPTGASLLVPNDITLLRKYSAGSSKRRTSTHTPNNFFQKNSVAAKILEKMDSKQPLNDIKWQRIKNPGFPHFNPKRWRHRHASRAMAPPGRGHGRCAVRDAQRHRLRG